MVEFAGTASSKLSGLTANQGDLLLPCFYLPPLIYFSLLEDEMKFGLEVHDSYGKQTFRNRTVILGANGPLSLSIPVEKPTGSKQLMKDVRIDYKTPWQKLHWKGIEAAYANSPFFEYYMDDFLPFYQKKTIFLADLNEALLNLVLDLCGIKAGFIRSQDFTPVNSSDDLRICLSPKRDMLSENNWFHPEPYHQVFSDRFDFRPNMGILDLLFNEGPGAKIILIKSKRDKS